MYRRSLSILISVIRISYRKITLNECPFNIQRRLGLGVAHVTLFVKVSGSSLGKIVFSLDFFILNKKKARRAQDNDMIFMCETKSVKPQKHLASWTMCKTRYCCFPLITLFNSERSSNSRSEFASSLYSRKQVTFLYSLQLKFLRKPHHRNIRHFNACVVHIFVF